MLTGRTACAPAARKAPATVVLQRPIAPTARIVLPPRRRNGWRWARFAAAAVVMFGLGFGLRAYRADVSVMPTVVPTAVPTVAPTGVPTVAPTVAPTFAVPTIVPTVVPTIAPVQLAPMRLFVDERFATPVEGWLNDPARTAWQDGAAYHLGPRQPGQFVALNVPGVPEVSDLVISGSFHKTGGPSGGGYGLIGRSATPLDGQAQDGRFYVFEVGDKGTLGIWLREESKWVDLVPWTASDAVKTAGATNELSVSALGDTMSVVVNGVPVTSVRDTTLSRGGVGVFVGGDENQVVLDRLTVRARS
jgi:hypothetical protein